MLLARGGTSSSLSKDEEALRVKAWDRKSLRVDSTLPTVNAVWSGASWDPGGSVARPAEVQQNDKTSSSTLRRINEHRSPHYVTGGASTSLLLLVPPHTRASLFSGFSATCGHSSQRVDGSATMSSSKSGLPSMFVSSEVRRVGLGSGQTGGGRRDGCLGSLSTVSDYALRT
eukprot:g10324.t1